jgi:hypothetical protein
MTWICREKNGFNTTLLNDHNNAHISISPTQHRKGALLPFLIICIKNTFAKLPPRQRVIHVKVVVFVCLVQITPVVSDNGPMVHGAVCREIPRNVLVKLLHETRFFHSVRKLTPSSELKVRILHAAAASSTKHDSCTDTKNNFKYTIVWSGAQTLTKKKKGEEKKRNGRLTVHEGENRLVLPQKKE